MVILGNFRTLLDVLIFMLWSIVVSVFSSPEGLHRSWKYCNTRSMRGVDGASSLFQLPAPNIHLIHCPRIEDVSDIKLIRTDTTPDLSQKAEK